MSKGSGSGSNPAWVTVVVGVVTAALGAFGASSLEYWTKQREMDIRMVEIAIGILREESNESIRPAREWSVDIVKSHSNVELSDNARRALVDNQLHCSQPMLAELVTLSSTPHGLNQEVFFELLHNRLEQQESNSDASNAGQGALGRQR